MDLKNIGRNDPCPCGSGKKFKNCHLGREDELISQGITPDSGDFVQRLKSLAPSQHANAAKWAEQIDLVSPGGKPYKIAIVDLAAYKDLNLPGTEPGAHDDEGGLIINPVKTRPLDPDTVYMAVGRKASDSTLLHTLAHAWDLICGSRLPHGRGAEVAAETGVPVEFLEHPQSYGDALLKLAEQFDVQLDAEDEIVAYLARRKMLLAADTIAKADRPELVKRVQKILAFMRDNQDEINARISQREGYAGA